MKLNDVANEVTEKKKGAIINLHVRSLYESDS